MHAGGSWWPLPEAIEHCAHVSAWFARLRTVANYAYGTLTLGRVFTEFVSNVETIYCGVPIRVRGVDVWRWKNRGHLVFKDHRDNP